MKCESEYVSVKKNFFYAFDGTKFDNAEECQAYEAKKTDPTVKKANAIKHTFFCRDYLEDSAYTEDQFLIFFPNTEDELHTLEEYADLNDVSFPCDIKVGEIVIFCAREFPYSGELFGYGTIGCCVGTPEMLKYGYCSAIDTLIQAAKMDVGMGEE